MSVNKRLTSTFNMLPFGGYGIKEKCFNLRIFIHNFVVGHLQKADINPKLKNQVAQILRQILYI